MQREIYLMPPRAPEYPDLANTLTKRSPHLPFQYLRHRPHSAIQWVLGGLPVAYTYSHDTMSIPVASCKEGLARIQNRRDYFVGPPGVIGLRGMMPGIEKLHQP